MDPLAMRDALLAELDREAAATRRVLERVPENRLTWRPHRKSMSLGALALHVAVIPGGVAEFLSEPARELPTFAAPEATSTAEVLAAFDQGIDGARTRLESWTDDDLRAPWKMMHQDATLIAVPRIEMLRSVMLNHWYHHRGELVVYLRLLDVPVPALYGPTADENPFAAPAGR